MAGKTKTVILIIVGLFILSWLLASLFSDSGFGNVAHIKVNGVIMSENTGGLLGGGIASSTSIVGFIEEANKDSNIRAILLEINSPGGSPVASSEIAEAVRKSNKTVVAWVRETGASGAYWVASPSYKIVAHPLSITGSIGVLGSYLQYSGLLERFNITYERLVAGDYKDMGSPMKELEADERKSLQHTLDLMHEYFIQSVADNRNMSYENVRNVSDGSFFLGMEAEKRGLVDFLGGKDVAEEIIKRRENLTDVYLVEYKQKITFFDMLASAMNNAGFSFGRGFSRGLMEGNAFART